MDRTNSNNKVFITLSRMIKKKYLNKFKDWHETATPQELKGVEILKFIMDTKGYKKADKTVVETKKNVKDLLNQPFK
jgi:hypothetical protein